MTNIHYKNLLKLAALQKEYFDSEEKIKEKHEHSKLQKTQITYVMWHQIL